MKKSYQTPEIEIKKLMMERIMDEGDPNYIDISEDQVPVSGGDDF